MRKKAGILFFLKFLKIPIYILNLSLTAKYFGVSIERDAWLLAFGAMMLIDNALWGPINETFRSKFIVIKEQEGERIALQKTKSLLFFIVLFSILISIIIVWNPNLLSDIIAPKFFGADKALLNEIIQYTTVCLLVNQMMQIGISILNAYNSFYMPEIAGFITSIINIALLIVLAPKMGIYALLVGYLIGTVVLLGMLVYQMNKLKIKIFSDYNKISFKDFRIYFLFALPFFLPMFFSQVSSLYEKTLSSSLGSGAVSTLDYSRKIAELLNTVFASLVTSLLVPVLTTNYLKQNKKEYVEEFIKIFTLGTSVIMFFVAGMFLGGKPVVKILFDKGNMSASVLQDILLLSQFYIWTLFVVFIYLLFGMSMLSSGKSKIYAFIGMVNYIIVIIINFFGVKIMGIYVFPVASCLTHIIAAIILYSHFPFERQRVGGLVAKYLAIIMLNSIIAFFAGRFIIFSDNIIIESAIKIILFLLLFFVQIHIFKMEERAVVIHIIRKRIAQFQNSSIINKK